MNKFKVGDKVKCISMTPSEKDKPIKIGDMFTISAIDRSGFITFPEIKFWFSPYNWQLVEEKPETKTHFVKLELEGIRPLSEEEEFKGIIAEEKPEDQIEDFVVNAAKKEPTTKIVRLPCESVTEITLKAEKGKTVIVKWI